MAEQFNNLLKLGPYVFSLCLCWNSRWYFDLLCSKQIGEGDEYDSGDRQHVGQGQGGGIMSLVAPQPKEMADVGDLILIGICGKDKEVLVHHGQHDLRR